jgi:hypothetical protein
MPGAGNDIPGGATLRFDVEVVDFTAGAPRQSKSKNSRYRAGKGKSAREQGRQAGGLEGRSGAQLS